MLRWAVGRHGDWIDRGPALLDGPLVTLHSDGRTQFHGILSLDQPSDASLGGNASRAACFTRGIHAIPVQLTVNYLTGRLPQSEGRA